MKKKFLMVSAVLVVAVLFFVSYSIMNNKNFVSNTNTSKSTKSANAQTSNEFRVKSAFADVDFDITLQDKDPADDDKTADYIFLTFSDDIVDSKKDDSSNPFNPKNYKLDGKLLSDASITYDKISTKITIKLPDGILKGLNTPQSLEISKDLIGKKHKKISGDLNIKLPYSYSDNSSCYNYNY